MLKDLKVEPTVVHQLLPYPPTRFTISGITKDETGAAVAGFTVYLFAMVNGVPVLRDRTISGANGVYSFAVNPSDNYWIVDYKSGSPDKAGATFNMLAGVLS
jgi:hypothetical protein